MMGLAISSSSFRLGFGETGLLLASFSGRVEDECASRASPREQFPRPTSAPLGSSCWLNNLGIGKMTT